MTIHQLLSSITKSVSLKSVVCLTGEEYPLLFCSQLFSSLKKNRQILVPTLGEDAILHAQLEATFLGNSSWYWLRTLDDLKKADQQSWLSYLYQYKGPNTIFFFSGTLPKPIPASWQVVKLPACADAALIQEILAWYNGNARSAANMVKKLTSMHDQISLDMAVVLVHYALVMGSKPEKFFTDWFGKLLPSNKSLFSLSQALFSKQSRQFFTLINVLNEQYVPQFWISFWSDQLWRACMYLKLMQTHKRTDAKRISFRLPFSFLNRDWRHYSHKELQHAHQFLYDVDYQLKHGGSPVALDLFYSKFLTGRFA